jgi:hypothetical protein
VWSMRIIFGDSSQYRDTPGENVIPDKGVRPNRGDQLLFGDNPALLCGERKQHFHHFGLDMANYLVPQHRVELHLDSPFPNPKVRSALFHPCSASYQVTHLKTVAAHQKILRQASPSLQDHRVATCVGFATFIVVVKEAK